MILVTGITGHTGNYFLKKLIKVGYKEKIRCVVRSSSCTDLLDRSGLDYEIVVGDLNDEEFVSSSMLDVDTIFHIYNIHHSPIIVKNAIKHKVKRVILVHTTGIYSKFKNASSSYIEIEEKVKALTQSKECATKLTILRPTMIYGDLCDSNMSKFIKLISKVRIMPVISGGKSLIQPVNARDLGNAYYLTLMNDSTVGKDYDLSGEKPIEMIEVFRLIAQKLERRVLFISIPMVLSIFFARLLKILSFNKIDYIERVQRMGENRSYPHEKASVDFGYSPMSFDKGIEIEVKQFINKTGR